MTNLLILSDPHFFNPHFYRHVVHGGSDAEPPSRLSTELALADRKINPFYALLQLVREGHVEADTVICCGDLTTCADPTAMNLGWLQLNRLTDALGIESPIITAGNHDWDSRFQTSTTTPQRMLKFLDPPFPSADPISSSSYWANGYCIIDRGDARFVLVNSCSLHGYETPEDRHRDHGTIPEELFTLLPEDLAKREPKLLNFLVCHHHPLELDLPAADKSVITNGGELIHLLDSLSPPQWMILHGHRHLPHVRYATASPNSPTIFSAGSFAANLHMGIQGRTANQFYQIEVSLDGDSLRGRYKAWLWDSNEGLWLDGEDTIALPSVGGFGYRPEAVDAAAAIANLVPPFADGPIGWSQVELAIPNMRYLLREALPEILGILGNTHDVHWESDNGKIPPTASRLRLGRPA